MNARSRAVRITLGLALAVAALLPAAARADDCQPSDTGCHGYNRQAGHYVDEVCATSQDPKTGSTITRIVIPSPPAPPGTVTGICLYLPPGYATSGLRYPVMYLLHGGLGDQADWVDKGQIRRIMDSRYAIDPSSAMIVVIPDAGSGGSWADALDGSFANETYLVKVVLPTIDAGYRTIPDRSARIVEGLSNGGYGAMHMAAKHPDLFVSAGGMSSNLELPTWSANYGTPANAPAYQAGQTPRNLVANLDDVSVILHVGVACEAADVQDATCWSVAVDLAFFPMNEIFVKDLRDAGRHDDTTLSYTPTYGEHQWKYWMRWLAGPHLDWHLARMQHASASPYATGRPAVWRYTTVAPKFDVWGYHVDASPARAREFLTLTDVRPEGLTLTGSGLVHVVTAPLYTAGATYVVNGASVSADSGGRLAFDVDLGPPHTDEEYTPQAQAAQTIAGSGYFKTVGVTIASA